MGKISVIGHFGFGKNLLNGQTIKTKIITDELERIYGKENIVRYDTHGGAAFVLRMPFVILRMLIFSKNIVMMPGDKGLFMMMPLLWLLNPLFGRKILYVVIGGWLPGFLEKWRHLVAILSRIEGIFVETPTLKSQLQSLGLSNIYLMPNCKRTGISSSLSARHTESHIPLCIFSRVMKEKGIEDAIEAVKKANGTIGKDVFTLDIYGQVWKGQEEWFKTTMDQQPDYISYKGCISYDSSVKTLETYFALLFPTYYRGECFAGTIIDAYAAGLPIIASDWHDNPNLIEEGKTGKLFPTRDVGSLAGILTEIYHNPAPFESMRKNCIEEAKRYQPDKIVRILSSHISI